MLLPLRRSDIANIIGITPESLSRAIQKFSDDGIATFQDQMVTIPDLKNFFGDLREI
ncbi:MAG: hypothetical protein CMM74_13475 [Rhodospirillaceae bacterium]|nr:hypothetical protein [Rhodospirillaceae bacterium]